MLQSEREEIGRQYFREITRKGGKARWAKVSKQERIEMARKLAQTRWAKAKRKAKA